MYKKYKGNKGKWQKIKKVWKKYEGNIKGQKTNNKGLIFGSSIIILIICLVVFKSKFALIGSVQKQILSNKVFDQIYIDFWIKPGVRILIKIWSRFWYNLGSHLLSKMRSSVGSNSGSEFWAKWDPILDQKLDKNFMHQ
mgnify:CR=1 FL=1